MRVPLANRRYTKGVPFIKGKGRKAPWGRGWAKGWISVRGLNLPVCILLITPPGR